MPKSQRYEVKKKRRAYKISLKGHPIEKVEKKLTPSVQVGDEDDREWDIDKIPAWQSLVKGEWFGCPIDDIRVRNARKRIEQERRESGCY